MKKYNEEYYSVIEKRTGRKIVDCGDFENAQIMLNMDPYNRQIVKSKLMMGQVVDIDVPKSLPTNEIIISTESDNQYQEKLVVNQLSQIKLPESQEIPFNPK